MAVSDPGDLAGKVRYTLGSDRVNLAHNFVENAGFDDIDFDAWVTDNVAYENVVVGWRRWAGFVEEGAQDSYFASNIGVMTEFEFVNPFFKADIFTSGWADNGTTQATLSRLTANNFFIGNTLFKPSSYSRTKSGGDYFAKPGPRGKGETFFWGNKGNVGFAEDSPGDVDDALNKPNDTWYRAEWVDSVAPGQAKLNEFNTLFNS